MGTERDVGRAMMADLRDRLASAGAELEDQRWLNDTGSLMDEVWFAMPDGVVGHVTWNRQGKLTAHLYGVGPDEILSAVAPKGGEGAVA